MEQVTVRFDNVTALDSIDFALTRGQTCVLLGEAGSGKTVLLKLALGLVKPDAGRVSVFGQDTTDLRERDWVPLRARMGILFQEGGLFDSLTVEQNVAYPLENIKVIACPPGEVHARAQQALDFVELGHTLDKSPSELSGGMRRRVGIARAVVTNPELTLYDSPTAGLDPITANTIMALIAKERDMRNATALIVTHRPQDGELLDRYRWSAAESRLISAADFGGPPPSTRFIVLRAGRIVFEGSLTELERTRDPYVGKFARRWKG
jgi:phospholipid/cholesterol/gamma-HCH transport system ATP-binding protein